MSTIEHKLLSKMTSLEEMQKVYDLGLRPEVFEDPISRLIFDFMVDYWTKAQMKQAPTWTVMEIEYPSVPLDQEVEESTEWLCEWLKKRFTRNRTQDIIRRTALKMDEDANAALSMMWQEAYEAAMITAPRSTRSDMSQNTAERRERYARDRDNLDLRGMSFGLAEVDEHTRGLLPGELAAVAAYTKVGKSWLLANAYVTAHKTGKRPILYTLEMDIEEMENRIDCLYSGVSYSRFMERSLGFEDMDKLLIAQDELAATGIAPLARPERGDRTVKAMMTGARQEGADIILTDQLSWIDAEHTYTGDSATRMKHGELIVDLKEEISRASQGKLPCFVAIQLNRQTMSRDTSGGGRGALENFANSSLIEQTVDIALGLWRNQDMRNSNLMGLDIMGTRRCDKKSWLLNWHLSNRSEIRVAEEFVEQPA
jgi:replicative DNA helicase